MFPLMTELLLVAATERELIADDRADPLCCGIGPVEAAVVTAQALASARYSAILHVGIAGATSLAPGTVVIGSEAIYCDVIDSNATLPRVHRMTASPTLIDAARGVMPQAPVAPIATCGRVGGGIAHEVEAMEGFGVLRAAELCGVPGTRGESDIQRRPGGRPLPLEDRRRARHPRRCDCATAPRAPQCLPDMIKTTARPSRGSLSCSCVTNGR